jgi:hypothetical protein
MKIYVASSWRNQEQPTIVRWLRACGQDVYDFKNPPGGTGFGWHQTTLGKPENPSELVQSLLDRRCEAGFAEDMGALAACDICILVFPAGISASLELGWACGAGKKTVVYIPDEAYVGTDRHFEPELMWKMADHLVTAFPDLVAVVAPMIEAEVSIG